MTPNISTVHYAEFQYVFKDGVNNETEWRIRDQIEAEVTQILRPFTDVYQDDSFCCQAEGFRLMSENNTNLISAAKEMAHYISRYEINYIKPL
jgi:hypothetical protein